MATAARSAFSRALQGRPHPEIVEATGHPSLREAVNRVSGSLILAFSKNEPADAHPRLSGPPLRVGADDALGGVVYAGLVARLRPAVLVEFKKFLQRPTIPNSTIIQNCGYTYPLTCTLQQFHVNTRHKQRYPVLTKILGRPNWHSPVSPTYPRSEGCLMVGSATQSP